MHRLHFGYLNKPPNTSAQDPAVPTIFFFPKICFDIKYFELILHFLLIFKFLSLVAIGRMVPEKNVFKGISQSHYLSLY